MQADWQSQSSGFAAALLRSDLPVPAGASVETPKRFAVYRNNVTLSLMEALEANFPAIRKLLGGEVFQRVALEHVRNSPPMSRLLAEYGARFPLQLSLDPMLADYPYLADVARLERLWLDAFHEADAPVLTPETLGTLPAGELFEARFKAHPATRLMASSFAAVSIFAASREGRDLSGIALARPEWALVTRPAFAVDVRMLDLGAFVFLEALVGGRTLGDATSSAAEVDQNFDLPTALGLMLTSGAFTSIKQETSP